MSVSHGMISVALLMMCLDLHAQCLPLSLEDRGPIIPQITVYEKSLCDVCRAFYDYYPLDHLQALNLPKACEHCEEAMVPLADSAGIWWSFTERGLEADETRRLETTVPPDSITIKVVPWSVPFAGLSDPTVFVRRDEKDRWRTLGLYDRNPFDIGASCILLWDYSVGEIQFGNVYAEDFWAIHNLDQALRFYATWPILVLNFELYEEGTLKAMQEIAGRFIEEPSGELIVHRRVLRHPEMEEVIYQAVPRGKKPYTGKLFVVTYHTWPAYALQYFLAGRPNTIFIEGEKGDLNRLVEPVDVVLSDSLQLLIHCAEVVEFRGDTSNFATNRHIVTGLEETPSSKISDLINHLIDPGRPSFEEVAQTNADTAQWPWTYHSGEYPIQKQPRY